MGLIDEEIWRFGSNYGLPNSYGKTVKRGKTTPAQQSVAPQEKENRDLGQRPKSQGYAGYGAESSECDLIDIIGRLRSERRPLQDISNKKNDDSNTEKKKKTDYLDLRSILRSQSSDTVPLGDTPEDEGENTAKKSQQPGDNMHNIASQISSISLDRRNSNPSSITYRNEAVDHSSGSSSSESEAPESHDDDTMSINDSHTLNTSFLPMNFEYQANTKIHSSSIQTSLSPQNGSLKGNKDLKNLCEKAREKVIVDMTKELDELTSNTKDQEKEEKSSSHHPMKAISTKGDNLKASCAGATGVRNELKKRGSSLAEICNKTNTSKAPPRVGLSKRARLEPLHDYLQKKSV
ncbi:Piso0_002274 [Millerozyma farinosa CBS 7064]|uniref:Piso0_002274 protein n=1 Tax=Pichia sorbitophila (strain ATCC MYA-4447 / BCRC 22081 / CBS 7064 / NBRC 10061 / NRRL Y-12695) TaxID=559304 RepID=G8YC63_PICSO|nr:Piso0_002274 [Millerozyma farinosa CBS 7064]